MFSAKGKDISAALARINKVTGGGASNEFVFLDVRKEGVWFSNAYDGKAVRVLVNGVADKAAKFGISRLMLDSAVSSRAMMQFNPSEGALSFSSKEGNYRGNVLTVQHQEVTVVTPEVRKAAQRESGSIQRLFGGLVEWTGISCIDGQTVLNLCVRDHNGRMTAVVSDQIHLAYVESTEPGGISLDMLLTSAVDIGKQMDSDKTYELALYNNRMYTWNEGIEISMPTEVEPSVAFEASANLVAGLKPTCIVELRPEELQTAIGNIMSIHEDGQEVAMQVGTDAKRNTMLKLLSKTNFGQISDGIVVGPVMVKGVSAMRANVSLLQDAARMATGAETIQLVFYSDRMFGIHISDSKKGVEARYLCASAMPKAKAA